ncbi:hypothetical protein [Streptomyces sp. R41]|uniref:4'-phosphopantetheinyl transferase N-terminal domain-containing protein n=1 Tax=Streptomyces sp. R41 TaxID=3238632 RepID=A0AB39RPK7_9ACTN
MPRIAGPDRARPRIAEPDRARPPVAEPDRPLPRIAGPDRPPPRIAEPDRARPPVAEPDRARPPVAGPDRPLPPVAKPDRPLPPVAKPDDALLRAPLPSSVYGALLRAVLPSWAYGAARAADVVPSAELFPEEAAVCAEAGPRRRAEFTAGRWCAHRALAALGAGRVAVPRGARGMPVWPDGVVGSITHCEGYRAAAVCRGGDARALGIDAEPAAPLPARVRAGLFRTQARVEAGAETGADSGDESRDEEDAFAADLARRLPGFPVDRLLFSAKEAAYKAWSSYADRPPPLRELRVVSALPDRAAVAHARPALSGTFTVRVPRGFALCNGDHLYGSWRAGAGLLISSALIVHGAAERLQSGSAWVSST